MGGVHTDGGGDNNSDNFLGEFGKKYGEFRLQNTKKHNLELSVGK